MANRGGTIKEQMYLPDVVNVRPICVPPIPFPNHEVSNLCYEMRGVDSTE